ncbi:hypothetical protein [Halobiforma nitratireducens]|uniref:Uncharacterized protein n=1 Tax=Halobiforma nitratireducens JCM 10879 TaxID=1227454 RepID=M0LSR0_9EURY|nr:hypothetical protein [Halobiforma nitratireducens]EMA35140.1 hypothetical protein C446_13329 [Halobiforma nitratireducens JCM 10879]
MKGPSQEFSGPNDDLSQFSKNRFFQGKLMTPRVMEIDRSYHAERLQTIARHVIGSGIVSGLEVESIESAGDGIEVTLTSGLALDGRGRPIVVEQTTTTTLPSVSADEIYLFIEYDEVAAETVPVPDTDGAVDDDTVPNRLVETFELTHRETPPETSSAPEEFDPTAVDPDGGDLDSVARKLANWYHEQYRIGPDATDEPAVPLGGYERTPDGSWIEIDGETVRPHVYDHETLAALLVGHLTDTDNPHETPVHEPVDPNPDVADIETRLGAVEESLRDLERERNTLARYSLRKTIKDRARFFDRLSERIEAHHGESSRSAREIAQLSDAEIADGEAVREEYAQHLSTVLPSLIELGEQLEGVVTERSLERYLRAVSQLQSTLETDAELVELIDADDRVCETVDSLDVLVDVVPDT